MTRRRRISWVVALLWSLLLAGCACCDDDDDEGMSYEPRAPRPAQYMAPGSPGVRGARDQRAFGTRAR